MDTLLGTTHEVVKNFPGRDDAVAALGPRAEAPVWRDVGRYWTLDYRLTA